MDTTLQHALTKVDAFIAAHPEYSRAGVVTPGQGSTNRVVFAKRGDEPVVFKVFCDESRRASECFALRHWKSTGFAPELIQDIDATMIVMSHIPGIYLRQSQERDDAGTWQSACVDVGRATGALTRVPLQPHDLAVRETLRYEGHPTFEGYLGRILELAKSIHIKDADFQDSFWKKNIECIESQLPVIFAQPRILYHQDFSNLHVENGKFTGFFDLEMSRVGTAAMQLGSAIGLFQPHGEGWDAFLMGWEAGASSRISPEKLKAAAAAGSLLHWREISRYLSYDGTPGTGYAWAEPADPVYYRQALGRTMKILGVETAY